jgi:hypothetical protein
MLAARADARLPTPGFLNPHKPAAPPRPTHRDFLHERFSDACRLCTRRTPPRRRPTNLNQSCRMRQTCQCQQWKALRKVWGRRPMSQLGQLRTSRRERGTAACATQPTTEGIVDVNGAPHIFEAEFDHRSDESGESYFAWGRSQAAFRSAASTAVRSLSCRYGLVETVRVRVARSRALGVGEGARRLVMLG